MVIALSTSFVATHIYYTSLEDPTDAALPPVYSWTIVGALSSAYLAVFVYVRERAKQASERKRASERSERKEDVSFCGGRVCAARERKECVRRASAFVPCARGSRRPCAVS